MNHPPRASLHLTPCIYASLRLGMQATPPRRCPPFRYCPLGSSTVICENHTTARIVSRTWSPTPWLLSLYLAHRSAKQESQFASISPALKPPRGTKPREKTSIVYNDVGLDRYMGTKKNRAYNLLLHVTTFTRRGVVKSAMFALTWRERSLALAISAISVSTGSCGNHVTKLRKNSQSAERKGVSGSCGTRLRPVASGSYSIAKQACLYLGHLGRITNVMAHTEYTFVSPPAGCSRASMSLGLVSVTDLRRMWSDSTRHRHCRLRGLVFNLGMELHTLIPRKQQPLNG